MAPTVKDNLIAAKKLIDSPEKWIKGENQRGDCFCIIGALDAVSADGESDEYFEVRNAIVAALPNGEVFISRFNDDFETAHTDVMSVFDRAIAAQDGVS